MANTVHTTISKLQYYYVAINTLNKGKVLSITIYIVMVLINERDRGKKRYKLRKCVPLHPKKFSLELRDSNCGELRRLS